MRDLMVTRNFIFPLFLFSFVSATIQGGAVSVSALLNGLPPSPQKYFEEVPGFIVFYFFSMAKHVFLAASAVLSLLLFLKAAIDDARTPSVVALRRLWVAMVVSLLMFGPMLFLTLSSSDASFLLVAGLKSWFPLLAVFVGLYLSRSDLGKFSIYLDWVIYFSLVVAILQQVSGFLNCSAYTFGCSAIFRSTGFFVEPNTLGAFAVCRVLFIDLGRFRENPYSVLAAIFLLILSGSRSMALIFIFALLLQLPWRSRSLLLLSGVLLLPLGYLFYERGLNSVWERLDLFSLLEPDYFWFGGGFGYGTQAHHLIASFGANVTLPPLADSQVLSLIYQGGIWALTFLVGLSAWFFLSIDKRLSGLILVVFWMSGLAIVTIEVWPLNILIFALAGHALRRQIDGEDQLDEEFT